MKIRSIRDFVMHKQLKVSVIFIAVLFVFSIFTLIAATYVQTTSRAKEHAEYIQLAVVRFFEQQNEQAETLNRSQEIRSYLAFSEQSGSEAQESTLSLPGGVVLYDTEQQVYPQMRYARLLPEHTGKQAFFARLSQTQLGYFTPFYNFTGNQVLGYLCFVIPTSEFSQTIRQSVPETMSFVIEDSSGNVLLDMRKEFRYRQELTVPIQELALTCVVTVDLESGYRSILLFSCCLIPATLILLLVSVWFSKRLAQRLSQPVNSLIASIQHNEIGDLGYVQVFQSNIEELDQLSQSYQSMMQRIKELMDVNQKQNLLRMESEIGMLQEKINPHFLFNTLEMISSQAILEDADQTAVLTQKLGTLFRYTLRAPDVISLKRELQYVKDYLYLQNVRFNDLLRYECNIDQSLLGVQLPKLSIQPLLENCLKHGFADTSNQPHVIRLDVEQREAQLVIRIDDDGCGVPEDEQREIDQSLIQDTENFAHFIQRREHIGLRNVNARLCMQFHIPKALWFAESALGGTCIELCLPLSGGEEEEETNHAIGFDCGRQQIDSSKPEKAD